MTIVLASIIGFATEIFVMAVWFHQYKDVHHVVIKGAPCTVNKLPTAMDDKEAR